MAQGIKELKMQHKKSTQQNNSPSLLLCRLSLVVSTDPIHAFTSLNFFVLLLVTYSFGKLFQSWVNHQLSRTENRFPKMFSYRLGFQKSRDPVMKIEIKLSLSFKLLMQHVFIQEPTIGDILCFQRVSCFGKKEHSSQKL